MLTWTVVTFPPIYVVDVIGVVGVTVTEPELPDEADVPEPDEFEPEVSDPLGLGELVLGAPGAHAAISAA